MNYDDPPVEFERKRAKPKAKPQRAGSLASFAEVLPQLCKQLDFDQKVQEMSLLALWPSLVGERYAELTRAVSVRKKGNKTVLYVRVLNAAVASDLSFQTESLKTMLNGFAPQTGVKLDGIQFTIGSL